MWRSSVVLYLVCSVACSEPVNVETTTEALKSTACVHSYGYWKKTPWPTQVLIGPVGIIGVTQDVLFCNGQKCGLISTAAWTLVHQWSAALLNTYPSTSAGTPIRQLLETAEWQIANCAFFNPAACTPAALQPSIDALTAFNEGGAIGQVCNGRTDVGACEYGHYACSGDALVCSGEIASVTEIQGNGIDDDCDGRVDEPSTRIVYVNRNGGSYVPGPDDSILNQSAVLTSPATFAAYAVDDASWNQILACVREKFLPFDVVVTDQEPSTPHIEAVVSPTNPYGNGGIAGIAAVRCDAADDAVVFTFPSSYFQLQDVCETIAHEVGHAFSLDHELECDDVMSYQLCGERQFRNVESECGEFAPRPCVCGAATQNSFAVLDSALHLPTTSARVSPSIVPSSSVPPAGAHVCHREDIAH